MKCTKILSARVKDVQPSIGVTPPWTQRKGETAIGGRPPMHVSMAWLKQGRLWAPFSLAAAYCVFSAAQGPWASASQPIEETRSFVIWWRDCDYQVGHSQIQEENFEIGC